MDDLTQQIAALRDALTPAWDEAHSAQLHARIERLQKRRRSNRFIRCGALGFAFVTAVLIGTQNLPALETAGELVARTSGAAYRELTQLAQSEASVGLQLTAAEDQPPKPVSVVVPRVNARRPAHDRTTGSDAEELMEAADAARLSNQPRAAADYLRRVLRDHTASPVAPLAGFTLGRVLLESLGQPSEAAEAFALARSIAPQGSLAQDALAREVEALSKAGHSREAYSRAQLYAHSYPSGRRLRAVRLLGGLP
jgi:TolA-binding protein